MPTDLVTVVTLDHVNSSQEEAEFIALELFREGMVSLGHAAELCATPPVVFMNFAAAQGVPPPVYGMEQFEEDCRRTLAKRRP
jgi:predicted HTH domain antitoxin